MAAPRLVIEIASYIYCRPPCRVPYVEAFHVRPCRASKLLVGVGHEGLHFSR